MKTTEDRAPILLLRRHAQTTSFIWAISLDGAPLKLRVSEVKDTSGKSLNTATAALVQASSGARQWSLVFNPSRQSVVASLANGASLRTDAPLTVR